MKKFTVAFSAIALLLMGWWFYQTTTDSEPVKIKIRFVASMGYQPLEFNQVEYANPGGEGDFTLRDVQLFVSNLHFQHGESQYHFKDSYHLVRFDGEKAEFEIPLQIPADLRFDSLNLGVGVDPKANGTIYFAGDLDPNSRMAWSWDVGYKFLLMEGRLILDTESIPLVYHVGFDENYTLISLPLTDSQLQTSNNVINLNVDFLSLFAREPSIDMADISTVKFDRDDARRIAQGFSQFITLCDVSCDERVGSK